jgi:hypothetical protein
LLAFVGQQLKGYKPDAVSAETLLASAQGPGGEGGTPGNGRGVMQAEC